MKGNLLKRFVGVMLVGTMIISSFTGCGGSDNNTNTTGSNNAGTGASADTQNATLPDTWIADRTIVVQAYIDDIGYSLPENPSDTLVMQELKARTGITVEIQYTPGDTDQAVMASHLASGTIPDVIVSYLDNSTRPEFPLLLKAAQEGMFANVSGYLEGAQVYSRYLEEGYLSNDVKNNIAFRDDLDGMYLIPLGVTKEAATLAWNPELEYIGGMYIQKSIAEALEIDPTAINTQEQLYDLLVQIKEGGFTDDNGNAVYPLGPKYYGGETSGMNHVIRGYDWYAELDGYNITKDGVILHEIETDYALSKVNYIRKLLAEDLINPEFFTMDSTRAEEVSKTKNSAIIADVNNYIDIIYETGDWIPLGPLNDFTGSNAQLVVGKGSMGVWAISAEAEKPEEIFAFFDYLATTEGQLLSQYGVEGINYTMADGYPVVTEETLTAIANGDQDYMINTVGASFGNSGSIFFGYMQTNVDYITDFGESRPGASLSDTFANAVQIASDYPREKRLVDGLRATAFLTADELSNIKLQMDLLNYPETLVQAMYANSDEEAVKILDSFKAQMEAAGLAQFKEYLMKIYEEDNEAIRFYN